MAPIFKRWRGGKGGSPSSTPAPAEPARGAAAAPLAAGPDTGAQDDVAPVATHGGDAGAAPVAAVAEDHAGAAHTPAAASWTAKGDTALKKSTKLASALADHEKLFVSRGGIITAVTYEAENGHHKLAGAALNGTPIEDGWFLYDGHWIRH